jgi:DNA mismatch endonuclease (patch repair protein)
VRHSCYLQSVEVKKLPFKSLPPDARTSARMAGVRQKDTTAELVVRRLLTQLGHRYRVRNRDLPGSPDVANRRRGWAIFVHGCFWHRHPGCVRTTTPTRNREFWLHKFVANVRRDERARRALRARGYRTITVWECETRNPVEVGKRLERYLSRTGD